MYIVAGHDGEEYFYATLCECDTSVWRGCWIQHMRTSPTATSAMWCFIRLSGEFVFSSREVMR